MDNLLLEKVYNILINNECTECNLKKACNLLESNGMDNICNTTIEILEKELNK